MSVTVSRTCAIELAVMTILVMLPRRQGAGIERRAGQNRLVQVAMTMPVREPDLDAEVLRDWARAIDDGPFSSLCWGERMAFDNPGTLTLMGVLAVGPTRVRLATTG